MASAGNLVAGCCWYRATHPGVRPHGKKRDRTLLLRASNQLVAARKVAARIGTKSTARFGLEYLGIARRTEELDDGPFLGTVEPAQDVSAADWWLFDADGRILHEETRAPQRPANVLRWSEGLRAASAG